MRYLEEPARSATPDDGRSLRWLRLALLGGLLLVAAIASTNAAGSWIGYFAAGVLGAAAAIAVRGSVRTQGDIGMSSVTRHAELGWAALNAELARSRRHDRRFVLIGIPDEVWSPAGAGPADKAQAGLSAAATVHGILRRPDRAWADGSLLHLLLTDCDREHARAFLERATVTMPQLFSDERVKMAVFPDNGITLGALLATLRADDADLATEGAA